MYSTLNGLQKPNQFSGGFIRIAPSVQAKRHALKVRGKIPGRRLLALDSNRAAISKYLKPMQLAGLGRMTPEQEAQKKAIKQAWKAERQSVKAAMKGQGKKALKAALIAAGATKKDWRQTGKMLKQSYKIGVDPLAPATPGGGSTPPTFPGGSGVIEPWSPPASTGSGGGGGGGAADYGDGGEGGEAAPASGGGVLPLALAAAGLYFLS